MSGATQRTERVRLRSASFAAYSLRDLATALFYYKRAILLAFVVPCVLGFLASAMARTSYTAQARLLVLYGSEYVFHPGNRDTGNDITLDRNQIIQGELQILQSPALLAQVLQTIGPANVYPAVAGDPSPLRAALARFTTDLVATSIPQSNIVELSVRNADRAMSVRVLSELINQYLAYRLSIFSKGDPEGGNDTQKQFANRLRDAENELAIFSVQHGITNLDEQLSLQLHLGTDNATLRATTAQQIAETAAQLDMLRKQVATVPPNVQEYAESTRSQQTTGLTDSLVKLEIQRRELLARYQSDFPLVRDVERQIGTLKGQIAGNSGRESSITRLGRNVLYTDLRRQEITLQSQLDGLQAKQAQLVADGDKIKARADELAGLTRHYRDLQRTRDVLDQSYRSISRSTEETQLSGALERANGANVRVVQPPDAPLTGRNPAGIIKIVGIALGMVAAAAVFALLNAVRQVFISVRDVERQLDLPVLLAVPLARRRPAGSPSRPRGLGLVRRPSYGV